MDEKERMVQVALATEGDHDALQRLIIEHHEHLAGFLRNEIDPTLRRRRRTRRLF